MFLRIAASKAVTVIKVFLTALVCAGAVIFSESCAEGVKSGIRLCLTVLVPSLFPFMAAASFIVNSGITDTICRPLKKVNNAIFGLNHQFAAVILLSLIGGYPIGAKLIYALYKNGAAEKKECERACMFCVCAGPGFLVNYVGMSLYHSKTIGIIMLASQMLSAILIGIAMRFFYKNKSHSNSIPAKKKTIPISNAVVLAAIESSKGMLVICAFVILFSTFTGVLGEIVPQSNTKDFMLIFLEVCSAVNELAARKPIELIAFAAGFGGLCVHFQIFSSLGELKINKLSFFCIRIIGGAIAALLTHFGLLLIGEKQQVFSTAAVESASISAGTVISAIALLGIAICFLYTLKNCKQN